jgi:hypothetical protein
MSNTRNDIIQQKLPENTMMKQKWAPDFRLLKIVILGVVYCPRLLKLLPFVNWSYLHLQVNRIRKKCYFIVSLIREPTLLGPLVELSSYHSPWTEGSSTEGPNKVGFISYPVHLETETEQSSQI